MTLLKLVDGDGHIFFLYGNVDNFFIYVQIRGMYMARYVLTGSSDVAHGQPTLQ